MGIGCVLFFWLLLAGAAAVVAAIGMFVLMSGVRKRLQGRVFFGSVVAAVGVAGVVGFVAFGASWIVASSRPHSSESPDVFRQEFGFEPAADVHLQSETSVSTDFTSRFLRFHASPSTIDAIVTRRFKAVPPEECERRFRSTMRKPDWWQPASSDAARCYFAKPFDDAFEANEAWLTYDPGSAVAHYHYVGVD